jgi:hypothetical protein
MFAKVEAGWLPGSLLTLRIVHKIIRDTWNAHPEDACPNRVSALRYRCAPHNDPTSHAAANSDAVFDSISVS